MSYSTKRSVREAEMRNERVYFKFIHDYVRNVQPDLYHQASNLHRTIRELYPSGVKDLTKTPEFMAEIRPGAPIPRHFYKKNKISNPSNNNNEREMVLKIHLLPQGETALVVAPSPTTTPSVVAPSPTTTPSVVAPSPTTPSVVAPSPTTPVVAPPPTQCPMDVTPLPPMEQHAYEELLKDLQCDPDLYQILNDFSENFSEDFTGDVDILGSTPLEQELQQNL